MLLKACLNGSRAPGDHLALPVTAEGYALDALAVNAAGATAVHVHVKDGDGADTFDADRTDAAVAAVRSAAPGLAIGVTTGAWVAPDPADRVAAIGLWTQLPDFASVNWHEVGAEEVAEALLERGIAVEAGLWHAAAVSAWLTSPLGPRCLRVLVELRDGLDAKGTVDAADRLIGLIGDGDVPILLHGHGSSTWPALEHAGRLGLATRIGLEDTLVMPDGSVAKDNAALVEAANHLLA